MTNWIYIIYLPHIQLSIHSKVTDAVKFVCVLYKLFELKYLMLALCDFYKIKNNTYLFSYI